MQDLTEGRGETIDLVHQVMQDIKDVTGDLKVETNIQGQKLLEIDENICGAEENLEKADEHLHQKLSRERTGNKCLLWCIIGGVLLFACLIFFGFFNKDKE